ARSYAPRARSRFESTWLICARTCRASACLDATEGSAVAETVDSSAAAIAMTNADACRFSELILGLRVRLRQAHRRGPGTSQVGHPSRGFGRKQPQNKPKTVVSR